MIRFTGTAPVAPTYALEDTEIHTWFERDRAHVELRSTIDDETILEFWDDDVQQAVDDGFISPFDWHGTMYDYAAHLGIIAKG